MRADTTTSSHRQSRTAYNGSMHHHLPLKNSKLYPQQAGDANCLLRHTILIEFLKHGKTIKSDVYYKTLHSLYQSIKSKWPGLLTESIILLNNNTCLHISNVTQSVMAKFKWGATWASALQPGHVTLQFPYLVY